MSLRKTNAPPQLLALLYHHFCYYKRHKIKLIFTILLPFVFLALLFFLTKAFTSGWISKLGKLEKCQHGTKSPFSAGPLQSMLSAVCEEPNLEHEDASHTTPTTCVHHKSFEFADLNYLDRILNGDTSLKCKGDLKCEYFESRKFYEDRVPEPCVVLKHKIFYYPVSNKRAVKVMEGVTKKLEEFQQFFEDSKFLPEPDDPANDPNAKLYKAVKDLIKKLKSFVEDPKKRVVGFENRNELIQHIRNITRNTNVTYLIDLWGVVAFEGETDQNFKYRILYDSQASYKLNKYIPWLQDLLDDSIVRMSGNVTVPFVLATKQQPNKCWPAYLEEELLVLLKSLITFAAIFSFLLSPLNFLEQILTEKSLKLREYLYIMGVGNFTLKFSWILFHLIFLIPLSIVFALFVIFMPYLFTRSNPSLIFVVILAFNICQLSFCYMLACAVSKPGRTGILLVFLNLFFWLISVGMFVGADFNGVTLVLARVCSLYCATPMAIAFGYLINWESFWLGAQWKTLFYSPNLFDRYGGLGECLLWLIGDTFLYLLTAWYLEKVFPGEFGVKHPPYFPFLPSYWLPGTFKKKHIVVAPEDEPDVEAATHNAEVGIFLKGLTKIYGKNRIGVNHLNLNFFKNEITAFLGKNGAGKSTTMNILVGLISASEGKAKVYDFDVQTQIDDIRCIVGFVPQYDILYPSTTVEEHLQFFGWLKGLSKSEINQLTEPVLEKLDLKTKKKNVATTLSGGQKRKLSILTAYLGAPDVIILDEPTSGVDPFSRRVIWELILQRRKNATTVLSTHFMEEADILGDRIAIIAEGELRCSGSTMYLKNKYGKGMHLIAACKGDIQNKDAVKEFVKNTIPTSSVVQEKGSDITFAIPMEVAHSRKMIELLTSLEEHQESLSVTSYGLAEPSLEDVFFAAIEPKDLTDADENCTENGEGIEMIDQVTSNRLQATSDQIMYSKEQAAKRLVWQAWGLFQKRLLYTVLSWSGYFLQILLPMAFVTLLLLIGRHVEGNGIGLKPVHIWQNYRQNVLFFQSAENLTANPYITNAVGIGFGPRCPNGIPNFECRNKNGDVSTLLKNPKSVGPFHSCACSVNFCTSDQAINQPNEIIPSEDKVYRIGSETNVTDWLIHVNSSDQTCVGGFQFKSINSTKWNGFLAYLKNLDRKNVSEKWINSTNATTNLNYLTVWYKNNLHLGIVNAWSNLVLRTVTGNRKAEIEMKIEKVKLMDISQDALSSLKESVALIISSFFLICCFAFGVFGIAVFVQYESSTGTVTVRQNSQYRIGES